MDNKFDQTDINPVTIMLTDPMKKIIENIKHQEDKSISFLDEIDGLKDFIKRNDINISKECNEKLDELMMKTIYDNQKQIQKSLNDLTLRIEILEKSKESSDFVGNLTVKDLSNKENKNSI